MPQATNQENKKTLTTSSENRELTELIAQAKAGGTDAYERLMRLYAEPILVYCRTMTRSEQDAQDAAQEVAIGVWRSIHQLESPYAFTKWLKRLTVYVVSDFYRKSNAESARRADFDEAQDARDGDIRNHPEHAVVRDEAKNQLFDMIRELPPSQKNALYFFYYEDMDYVQIAKTLDISVGSVSSNLKKAKKNLKKMAEQQSKKTENILENLHGAAASAAMGPAIAGAFQSEAQRLSANGLVNHFCEKAAEAAHFLPDGTGNVFLDTAAKHGIPRTGQVFLGTGIVAAAAVCTLLLLTPPQGQAPLPDQTIQYAASNAQIEFTTASDVGKNVNPTNAEISVNDNEGQVSGWRINDGSGAEIARGDGPSIQIPGGLADGKYTVIWEISNIAGAVSEASRDFYIQK